MKHHQRRKVLKKNIAIPSAEFTTPSNQLLANAPTTTVPAKQMMNPMETIVPGITDHLQGSSQLQSPSDIGISESAPSTSGSLSPIVKPFKAPSQKVSQSILNKVVFDHLSGSKFNRNPDMVDKFFSELSKNGYSDTQIENARKHVSDESHPEYLIDAAKRTTPEYKLKEQQNVKQNEINQEGILNYLSGTLGSFNEGFRNYILTPLDGASKIVSDLTGLESSGTFGEMAQASKESDKQNLLPMPKTTGGEILGGVAQTVPMLMSLALTPELKVAQVASLAETAPVIMPKLSTQMFATGFLNKYSEAENLPEAFKAGTQGGLEGALMHGLGISSQNIGEIASELGAGKLTSKAAASVANGTLFGGYASAKEFAEKGETSANTFLVNAGIGIGLSLPEMKGAIIEKVKDNAITNYFTTPSEQVDKIKSTGQTPEELRKKSQVIGEKAIEEPKIEYITDTDKAGNSYFWETNIKTGEKKPITQEEYNKQTEIQENERKTLISAQQALNSMADIIAMDDAVANNPQQYIDAINADNNLTPEQKQIFIDKITVSAEKDAANTAIENAKIQHISDLEAIGNPGSKEFYQLAENILDDNSILSRVKSSIDEAVKAGELSPEEGDIQFQNLKDRVDIQEVINPELKDHPELAMQVADLIKEKREKEDDLRKVKSFIPSVPEITIRNKERAIESIDQKLNDLLKQAKEKTKISTSLEDVKKELAASNPDVGFTLFEHEGNYELNDTNVKDELKGTGKTKQFLFDLIKIADREDKKIFVKLTNELDPNTDVEKLKKLYEASGFKQIEGNKYVYEPAIPEAPKEGETVNTQQNATQKGEITEGDQQQHQNGDERGTTTKASDSDSNVESGQVKKEIAGEEKTRAIWKRIIDTIKDKEFAAGLEKEGVNYLVKKEAITESAAQDILNGAIETNSLPDVEKLVLDESNKMDPITRGVLSAMLGKHYFELADKEVDTKLKQDHYDNFFKYTDKAAAMATEGGQIGNAIGKVIKKMYANNPETIIAKLKKDMADSNEKILEKDKEKIDNTYKSIQEILDIPEVTEAIKEKVKAGVEEEVDKINKKLSISQKLKADKAIEALDRFQKKIKANTYSSVSVAIISEGITVTKLAIKAGVDIIDAIELGIEKIKELHGKVWDKEADFRKDMLDGFGEEKVDTKSKRSVTPKEKGSILDAIEKKAGRLKPENRDKFLKDIIQEVEKEGGLSEQRFKELYAQALELPSMTPELIEVVKDFSKIINEGEQTEKDYMKALDEVIESENSGAPSEEIKNLQKQKNNALQKSLTAQLKAKQANAALSQLFKGNKKLADTWIGMMQLGALTPLSLAKNITAMPAEVAFRALSGHVSGALDYVMSGLSNVGILPESFKGKKVNSIARMQGAWGAHPRALKKMYDTLIHGSFAEDYTSREIANKITPIDAFNNIVKGKTKGDLSALAANIMEALPQGYLAAGMGRALAGPDAFFRTIGEQSKAYELGKLEGLKGAALEKFMADPPPEAKEKIIQSGNEITFQQDNLIIEALSGAKGAMKRYAESKRPGELGKLDKAVIGALRVLSKSQALYIKTPTNVLGSVIRMISPEYSLFQAARKMYKGDKEGISKYLADAAVGYALRYVIVSAIKHGLVTPTTDYKSKEGKVQSDENIKHGGKFNKSAYMRMLSGGDWKEQKDDIWVDYSKWTGGLGIAVGAYASMLDGVSPEDIDKMTMAQNSYKVLPTVLKQVMDLSFMSTTAQMVDAMRDGQGIQKWATSTTSTIATPLIPNTVATVSKAGQDTKKETRSKDILENITNDFKYKLFSGDELPSKITLWGEKVSSAPKGSNKYTYALFDISKAENPDENSLGYKIMDLYQKTRDERIIPSQPSNQITIGGKKVPLDGNQYELLQTYIGGLRKILATDYLNEEDYKKDDDNTKAQKLQNIYGSAHKQGIDMLVNSDDRLTDIKNESSGTSPLTGNRIRKSRKQRKRVVR